MALPICAEAVKEQLPQWAITQICSGKMTSVMIRVSPTTVKEAKLIKERFTAVLSALERRKNGLFELGCPHCHSIDENGKDRTYDCDNCRYNTPPFTRRRSVDADCPCICVPFGEHTGMGPVSNVIQLSPNTVCIVGCVLNPDAVRQKDEQAAIIFARGHIEWADEVIRRGGTMPKEKHAKKS